MSNKGKYKDTTPLICPAGIVCERKENVKDCIQVYKLVDEVDAVKNALHIKEEPFPYRPKRSFNYRHPGIYIESKDVIRPAPKTRYETVINDLRETSYDSYWNKELGSTRDSNGAFPKGMDPDTTFGLPIIRDHGVAELVNPEKSHFEVLLESQEGHDMYRTTHNDYNPGERIDRGYLRPAYDPDKRFGMTTIYDPKGIWVKCATTWHLNDPLEMASVIQADFVDKRKPKLGKALQPNNNIARVPKDYMFGMPCKREMCGVQELLKDPTCKPNSCKRVLYKQISNLNNLRAYIKARRDVHINLKDMHDSFLFHDKEKSGWISLDLWKAICECFRMNCGEDFEPLARVVEVIKDDKIDYEGFLTLIDCNKYCPRLKTIQDVREGHFYYTTTNMAAALDYKTMDNRNMRPAGVPTIRMDTGRPRVLEGQCKADLESLGDETTAKTVVNPSIFTNYGLTHRDFFMPRTPEYIRKLFENCGYQFPEDTFEKLWQMGVCADRTGSVCIDTFKQLLACSMPPPTFKCEEEHKCNY